MGYQSGGGASVGGDVTEAEMTIADNTTNNSSTSAHGFLKKLDNTATNFMDGTGAWDTVKDSDLAATDITTNNSSTSNHGFLLKLSNVVSEFMTGTGVWAIPSIIPQNSQSAAYPIVIGDAGKHILHPTADNSARVFTIPASSTAFPIGTVITFVNQINTVQIAITTDTLTWADDNTTGTRTLAAGGIATVLKVETTKWVISGTGLT